MLVLESCLSTDRTCFPELNFFLLLFLSLFEIEPIGYKKVRYVFLLFKFIEM